MIIITKNKKIKEYQIPEMPNFESRRLRVAWLKRQRMQSVLLNIKSVSVQVKDIKQMIYSQNPRLLSLYSKIRFANYNSDDDYITISKTKELNKSLMYAILTADWLINKDDINSKSTQEIKQECIELEDEIIRLKKYKDETTTYHLKIDDRIKLLQYKLSCLTEYYNCKNDEIENDKRKIFGINDMYRSMSNNNLKYYQMLYEQEEKDNDRAIQTLRRIIKKDIN